MSALLFAKIGSLDNAREAYSGATAFNFQLSLEGRPHDLRSSNRLAPPPTLPHRGPQRGVLVSSGSHTKESRPIGSAAVRNLMTIALKVRIRFA